MPKETDADSAETPAGEPEESAAVEEPAGDNPDDVEEAAESDSAESSTALKEAEDALEAAQAEIESLKDQALRAAAETENVRKRADRSIENAHKYALERFVGELLPAVDSFERAVTAAGEVKSTAGEAVDALAEGVELSLKLLLEAMGRQGIEVVDPIGATLRPETPRSHEHGGERRGGTGFRDRGVPEGLHGERTPDPTRQGHRRPRTRAGTRSDGRSGRNIRRGNHSGALNPGPRATTQRLVLLGLPACVCRGQR